MIDLGGEVVLHGDEYDSAYEHALTIARERNLAFVHPFDDPDVIAGQGTIGMEILRQQPGETLDAIFVPVGGGGLIAGIARVREIPESEDPRSSASSRRTRPRCTTRCRRGKRVTLERVGIFADGVAVRRVGEEPFRLCAANTSTR